LIAIHQIINPIVAGADLQFPIQRRGALDHDVDNAIDILGKEAANITTVRYVRRAFIYGWDGNAAYGFEIGLIIFPKHLSYSFHWSAIAQHPLLIKFCLSIFFYTHSWYDILPVLLFFSFFPIHSIFRVKIIKNTAEFIPFSRIKSID
jgi:hypothetical protein